jgi:hypothetical protein
MTKKKQQEIEEAKKIFNQAILKHRLDDLDFQQAIKHYRQVMETEEVITKSGQEPEEDIQPMTLDLKEAIVDDIIKEKGDIS